MNSISTQPQLHLQCPGKIFILGEYACLVGAPALVHTLEPKYNLIVEYSEHFQFNFATDSPAARLLKKYEKITKGYAWKFNFKEQTSIGTGSSTAEYLLTKLAIDYLSSNTSADVFEIRKEYLSILDKPDAILPSGVDLIAQYTGGLTLITQTQVNRMRGFSQDIRLSLFYTGSKVKTHEHLAELKRQDFPHAQAQSLAKLAKITQEGIEAIKKENIETFGDCLNRYQVVLNEFLTTSKDYQEWIKELQNIDGVYGCKGSGSQGGDCILIAHTEDAESRILKWAENIRLTHPKTEFISPHWTNVGKEFVHSS